ncbi:succinate--CoA ligase [GDP-forming] subunit beta, mitochondrial-like [Halichondria panicea]|uniref:succinate--CoA ligase [GDP-forming] subunit beta, mitochondrial-like n=1 Tax=Halichondria panicea TaxID=6063 RepID=UPI00312B35AF
MASLRIRCSRRILQPKMLRLLVEGPPCAAVVPVRHLNLHEYQSKRLMEKFSINTQKFQLAETASEAATAARSLGVDEVVLKAQIMAGGRGKGVFSSGLKGGVKVTKDLDSIGALTEQMIGYKLETKQTTGDGVLVHKVMVAESLDIARETYFAIVMDRSYQGPVMVGSPAGGVDIEEVSKSTPEKIFKIPVDIWEGITREQARQMAENLEFKGTALEEAAQQITHLYNMFIGVDATQVEINPLGETPQGKVVCFDAKINFDDSAKFRQADIFKQEDTSESDPREVEAAKDDLNYIGMTGNIGCLVNGAGLAMATMDIIKLHNGEPANFLDVGGGVSEDQVLRAFKLLTKDPQVKCILVNIFGGIVNCETIANGIIKACQDLDLTLPLIVRLEGTNVEQAKQLLYNSGLAITPADDFEDVAQKAVASLTGQ